MHRLTHLVVPRLAMAMFVVAALTNLPALTPPARCAAASEPAAEMTKPNVIFILCDDLGWGDLGILHQYQRSPAKRLATPHLDQMAAEGMQLRAHYCPAPVCAPSRASLLTGVHQGHAHVRDNQFDKMLEDNHTLATVMKEAGYTTALIGKYGLQGKGTNPTEWRGYPTRRGFDEFFGYVRHVDGHLHYPANEWPLGGSPNHQSPKELWHNDQEISSQLDKCYTTDLFTARAKHWITSEVRKPSASPFFLYLAYDTPHAALQIPTSAYPDGRGLAGGIQWLGTPGKMINTAVGEIDSFRHPDVTSRGWTDVEERFATMVRRIDDGIGDLLQTLRDLDIDRKTIVVLSSDNGPHHESYLAGKEYDPTSFQSYGIFEGTKRDVWEGGIRMPTLVWGPGRIPEQTMTEQPSQSHDWMPTFAEFAGIAAPARTDGVSLVPTLTGKGTQAESQIYIEYFNNGRTKRYDDFAPDKRGRPRQQMQVIHLDGFKGLRRDIQSHDDPFEIYHLRDDPQERNNLAGSSDALVQLEQRMKDRVLQIRMRNDSAKRPYDDALVPPVSQRKTHPGVLVEHFAGEFPFVPSLDEAVPTRTTHAASMTEAIEQTESAGAVRLSGWIDIPADGEYEFIIAPTHRAFVRIHEAAVIDADFGFASGQTRAGTMRLAKGLHPYRVTMLAGEEPELNWQWSIAGQAPTTIPEAVFVK